MYEVKVTFQFDNMVRQVTLATFERDAEVLAVERRVDLDYNRVRAIKFAKQIDKGYAVAVVRIADEDNREANFGLVYARDAEVA